MGEEVQEGTVEDNGYEILGVFGWQDKRAVALARTRPSEEDIKEYESG